MRRNNHYFGWGLTAVCVVCAVLLIYDLVFRDSIVLAYLRQMASILAPILYGCAMAYLLAPIVKWFERSIFRHSGRNPPAKLVRGVSILLTWLVVFALLYGLLSVLLPELVESVKQLAANAQGYYYTVYNWVLHLLENNPEFAARAREVINEYYTDALTWINDNLMPQVQLAVTALSGGVVGVLVFFKNLFIGVMVSLYLLGAKESFSAAGCKLCYTLLPEDRAALFIRGVKATDRIFSGFVRGKLLDSLIIGILCFFFSSLFEFPYAPLVSVVVGVTNIIPFFGPFLGAIPSAFLILLDSPIKCLYFILFILALQQFDGNILGPRILGDSTGISGFWVIVAILVGGGLWGVAGMFLGVPIFACIYAGVRAYASYRLRRKGLPVPASCYATHEPVWPDDGEEKQDKPG
ncbi:MAG: AI-2E family transporter [Oscillospiraceae bacterium]|nr:AI-2E family transporter [Oscillospiraceae bacterium]MCI9316874.1 AI-2E family transporter [Oscillospiraceae bacterium]